MNNKSLKHVGPFPNIRKNKVIQLTEKQLKSIIEKALNNEDYDIGPTIGEPKDKHGYDDSGNETAMGWWGLEGGGNKGSDYSSPSFDSSSDVFDLKESLKKELRKYL